MFSDFFFSNTEDTVTNSASNQDVLTVVKEFSNNTTIHGLQNLSNATSFVTKFFWSVAFVAAVIAFVIQFSDIIEKYNAHTIKTIIEVKREPVKFPDITICPLRNLDIAIIKSIFDQSLDRDPGSISGRHPYNILALNLSRSNPAFEEAYFNLLAPFYHLFVKFRDSQSTLFGTMLSRSNILPNVDREILKSAMIPTWEFLFYCRWQGKECDEKHIKPVFDPYFLKCITFQPPDDTILSEGVESGLTVAGIYGSRMVNWKEYLQNITYPHLIAGLQEFNHPLSGSQGARVVVHPRGSPALPAAEGLDVPPGYSASIGISFQRNVNLGEPFGKCSTEDPRAGANETYRLLPCLRRCIQEEIIRVCKCVDARVVDSKSDYGNIPYCGKAEPMPKNCSFEENPDPPISCLEPIQTVTSRIQCGKDVQSKMERQESVMNDCGCYTPCDEVKYTKQYSISGFPPGPEMDSIYAELMAGFNEKLLASNPSKLKLEMYQKHFQFANRYDGFKDIAKINIRIADTSIVKTIQKSDYTSGDLLSDIGGNLGLFIGMSLLSIGEILQLLWDILYTVTRKRKKNLEKVECASSRTN